MQFPNRCFAIAVAALSSGVFAAAEDLTIVSRVTRDGGAPETTTSYLSSERMRMSNGEGREALVDFKLGQMVSVDHKRKTYSVTTQKDIDEAAAKLQERLNSPEMKKAREAMKDLPPEQRKALAGSGGAMFQVEKGAGSRKIAGYTCENWTIAMGQFSRSEECLTTELKFPVPIFEMYKHFTESMRTMMASLGAMGQDFDKTTEELKKIKGFPLAVTTTVGMSGRTSVTASEVVEVKKGPIPASAWEVPAGYAKVENAFARVFEGRRRT